MATNYDIPVTPEQAVNTNKLIIRTFGLQTLKTKLYNIPQSPEIDKELYKSQLGTPVFSNLELKGGNYTYKGKMYSFPDIKIDTVLFTVAMQKNIIVTPIQGGDGTVKEYISDKDYLITVRGVLTGGNQIFPRDAWRDLIEVVKAKAPIQVNSWYLNDLDIFNLVITDYEFPQDMGTNSQQPFIFSALSDVPIELKLR